MLANRSAMAARPSRAQARDAPDVPDNVHCRLPRLACPNAQYRTGRQRHPESAQPRGCDGLLETVEAHPRETPGRFSLYHNRTGDEKHAKKRCLRLPDHPKRWRRSPQEARRHRWTKPFNRPTMDVSRGSGRDRKQSEAREGKLRRPSCPHSVEKDTPSVDDRRRVAAVVAVQQEYTPTVMGVCRGGRRGICPHRGTA